MKLIAIIYSEKIEPRPVDRYLTQAWVQTFKEIEPGKLTGKQPVPEYRPLREYNQAS